MTIPPVYLVEAKGKWWALRRSDVDEAPLVFGEEIEALREANQRNIRIFKGWQQENAAASA